MVPTITLGAYTLRTRPLLIVLAIVVAAPVLLWRLGRHKEVLQPSIYNVVDVLFYIVIGALAGSWLVSVLPHLAAHWTQGTALSPTWWRGEQRWMGALGGGSLVGYAYCRWRKLDTGRAFDLFAPLPALIFAIIRVGCLCAGCCYGKITTAWPSLVLPDIHGVWVRRYPTQLVSIGMNLLIFAALLAFERIVERRLDKPANWPFPGFLFLLYVELYCLQRFYFEFWRADMPLLVGPLTWTHLYCTLGIGLATGLMVRSLRQRAIGSQGR